MKSYYDVPMLKEPVWKPEVSIYFFLGGLSAGSYILSCFHPEPEVSQKAGRLSALAALPCAPLLILDLGDPWRFLYMLRVWKPTSPMNLGSWILATYTPLCLLQALRPMRSPQLLGIPLAIALAGYTGVLLSTTSNPLWCKNPWLGPLFSASAIHSASSALSLLVEGDKQLTKVDLLASAATAGALKAFEEHDPELTAPIRDQPVLAAGLILPVALTLCGRPKLAAGLALLGALALRLTITTAGKTSARNAEAARRLSRSTSSNAAAGPPRPQGPLAAKRS